MAEQPILKFLAHLKKGAMIFLTDLLEFVTATECEVAPGRDHREHFLSVACLHLLFTVSFDDQFFFFFFKIFYLVPFLKSVLNLLQYCFCCSCIGFLAKRYVDGMVASWPGAKPTPPLHWKAKS